MLFRIRYESHNKTQLSIRIKKRKLRKVRKKKKKKERRIERWERWERQEKQIRANVTCNQPCSTFFFGFRWFHIIFTKKRAQINTKSKHRSIICYKRQTISKKKRREKIHHKLEEKKKKKLQKANQIYINNEKNDRRNK